MLPDSQSACTLRARGEYSAGIAIFLLKRQLQMDFLICQSFLLCVPKHDFDASVCVTKFDSFCLSDLPLFNLKFSTHQRSPCFDDCLIVYLAGMSRPGLVIVFVAVLNTLAVDELTELPG